MGLDLVDLHDEGKLIVNIDNDVYSSQSDEAHHQASITSQRYKGQSVPVPDNQSGW